MYPSCPSTSAYVSDLPVRLTNKFRPLPNYDFSSINLEGALRFPTSAFSDEYDFSTEKKALQDFDAHMRSLSELQRQLQQTMAPSASSATIDSPPFVESATSSTEIFMAKCVLPMPAPPPSTDGPSAILLPTAASILQPVPASFSSIADQEDARSSRKTAQARVALSLEDFENVQSSPFDALELKTINDIEELRRISTQQQPFLPVNPQQNGFLL